EIMFASGSSGAFTRLVCQPFDVLKIRLQIQSGGKSSLYRSGADLIREEGLRGLWKGHSSAQILSIVYGLGQFGVYGCLSKQFNDSSGLTTFAIGNAAGLTATLFSYPFDVVRTRLVAQRLKSNYRGTLDAFVKIGGSDGKILFRGFLPTLLSQMPYSGFQFFFYKFFFSLWRDFLGDESSGTLFWSGSTVCSVLSGLTSKLIVFPLDTVKKQMQVSGFSNYGGHKRILPTVVYLWKSGGLRRFYCGLTPGLLKAMATT
ncbi:Mitochondrial deoxynucleotide carrier, partial [Caligus rogercresseyi]